MGNGKRVRNGAIKGGIKTKEEMDNGNDEDATG